MAALSWLMNLGFAGSGAAAAPALAVPDLSLPRYGFLINSVNNVLRELQARKAVKLRKNRILVHRNSYSDFPKLDIKSLRDYGNEVLDSLEPTVINKTSNLVELPVTVKRSAKPKFISSLVKIPVSRSYNILHGITRYRDSSRLSRRRKKKLIRLAERFN